jgi:thiamine pyrophosphate-dependent acetolactate synthase large subunit-like protein
VETGFPDQAYPGIIAPELGRTYTVEITLQNDAGEVTNVLTAHVSPYTWAYDLIEENKGQEDQAYRIHRINLAVALFKYGEAAKAMSEYLWGN